MFERRACPICGESFTPKKASQIYDKAYCRTIASRARRKASEVPIDETGMLDEIRKRDPETARDIEKLAYQAGLELSQKILMVCWRAMNRAAVQLSHEQNILATNFLIEAGRIAPKKRRKSKKDEAT